MQTVFGSCGNLTEVDWSPEHLPAKGNLGVFISDPFDGVLIPVKMDHSDAKKARKQAYNIAYRKQENVAVLDSRGHFVYTANNGW